MTVGADRPVCAAVRIGDPCPLCGAPFQRRPRMFFWRGEYFDGAVCSVHGLWAIKGEEMPPLRPVVTPQPL